MNKEILIQKIQKIQKEHKNKTENIEELFNGKSIKELKDIDKKSCAFGAWLYNPDNCIKHIVGEEEFNKLDKYYDDWSRDYNEIYDAFFKQSQRNLLSSLFKKGDSIETYMANFYHKDMIIASYEISNVLESCKNKINTIEKVA